MHLDLSPTEPCHRCNTNQQNLEGGLHDWTCGECLVVRHPQHDYKCNAISRA